MSISQWKAKKNGQNTVVLGDPSQRRSTLDAEIRAYQDLKSTIHRIGLPIPSTLNIFPAATI